VAPTALSHDRNGFAATIEDTGKVCLNDVVPFLNCQLVYWLENADAGVVHQDVKPPESFSCPLDHAPTFLVAADIRHRSFRPALTSKCVKPAKRHFQRRWIVAANEYASAFSNQSLGNAQSNAPGAARYDYLRAEVNENFGGLLGQSPALKTILSQIELVASTEANVLIQGESGTGKELVARALHDRGSRASHALVKVNCASIPRDLFESEFFGHARGSFTGALRDRIGRFELADGGTLFLDEVAEIPLESQSKLLRVLQEGEFERVGEDRTRQVNVRVIAATNRNLEQEVEAGRFRRDLYFRLSVFPLEVPPLRDRREDILILAATFVAQAAKRMHCPMPVLTRNNVEDLTRYAWPGNIRELQNVIERAVILAGGGPLRFNLHESADPLPAALAPTTPVSTRAQLVELGRTSIMEALERSGGKIYGPGGAAEILRMRPTTLSSKIAALQIKRR
jgi:transcriptional regulator with GAF, ATPase, and Fis domain